MPPALEQLPAICPLDVQTAQVGSSFTFYLLAYDESMIQSVAWDFGDGESGSGIRASHQYDTSGVYTVTCTITSTDGEVFTREETCVAGRNIAPEGEAVVSHQPQGGGGNPDIGVIADGVRPVSGVGTNTDQFDTYHWEADTSAQWIGYTFEEEHTFGMVAFQEGNHFTDGGWFAGGLHIQVQRDGEWIEVDYTGDPYPVSSDRDDFGESLRLSISISTTKPAPASACTAPRRNQSLYLLCGTGGMRMAPGRKGERRIPLLAARCGGQTGGTAVQYECL